MAFSDREKLKIVTYLGYPTDTFYTGLVENAVTDITTNFSSEYETRVKELLLTIESLESERTSLRYSVGRGASNAMNESQRYGYGLVENLSQILDLYIVKNYFRFNVSTTGLSL